MSIDYYDEDLVDNRPYMKVTLLYDTLPINLEQRGGMWLGVGLGSSNMIGADIVIC
jgi:hypothetical protein